MRTRRWLEAFVSLALLAAAAAVVWIVEPDAPASAVTPVPVSWRGLVGAPRATVQTSGRSIVLLRTPSVAERLAKQGYATESDERAWTSQVLAAQSELLTSLELRGLQVKPDFRYARVVDGFAAVLDPRAAALLEGDPEVLGVYPVRAAFPASLAEDVLSRASFGRGSGHRPGIALPGYDGNGVTVALLDTGVDAAHPYLHGRVEAGVNIAPAAAGDDRHGTELAGLVVGAGGPGGLRGVAPRATIFPIRVAARQAGPNGGRLVYARSDQLLAGLERAVDPNGDGDCHDAARVALVGVVEPYAAFADGPEARAVQGALDLNTVVVAPAGNDGPSGPDFGSVAGPAGASAAIAVAASDTRATAPSARVVFRAGLHVVFDRRVPLAGAPGATPERGLSVASPPFVDARGESLVSGRAVLAPTSRDPRSVAAAAARAGAAALVFYGTGVPAGGFAVGSAIGIPVVTVPAGAVRELLAFGRRGVAVSVAVGGAGESPNPARGSVAPFSSRGLAFDGGPKPNLSAPGVGLATSAPGFDADGTPNYVTLNGTSAAAAVVAGGVALVAQMRPALAGAELASALTGYAPGSGALDVGASAVAEVVAAPASIAFGVRSGRRWRSTRALTLTNVSSRPLELSLDAVVHGGDPEALRFQFKPSRLTLRRGHPRVVTITASAPLRQTTAVAVGAVEVTPSGGSTLRVPFAVDLRRPGGDLIGFARLTPSSLRPSDTSPAVLDVGIGAVLPGAPTRIEPALRLDVLLYTASGRFLGVLARQRDLLPGTYSFGITGRGPDSTRLAPGRYELRLVTWPVLAGRAAPARARVRFAIE